MRVGHLVRCAQQIWLERCREERKEGSHTPLCTLVGDSLGTTDIPRRCQRWRRVQHGSRFALLCSILAQDSAQKTRIKDRTQETKKNQAVQRRKEKDTFTIHSLTSAQWPKWTSTAQRTSRSIGETIHPCPWSWSVQRLANKDQKSNGVLCLSCYLSLGITLFSLSPRRILVLLRVQVNIGGGKHHAATAPFKRGGQECNQHL